MNLLNHRAAVREAVWLYIALNANTTNTSEEWLLVANGNVISDEELAVHLTAPAATVRRWRIRLEKAGVARSEFVPPRHRRIWIQNPNPLNEADRAKPVTGLIN